MELLIASLIGLLAGAHIATWGMYKDAIHEGFTYRRYSRSIVLGVVLALVWQSITEFDLTRAANMVVLFGLVYVAERGIGEFYKTFIRDEDQSKYFIPMQFHVFGRVVQSRRTRLLVGAGCVLVVLLAMVGIHALQQAELPFSGLVVVLLIGSIGGWISALGGAWKDAPLEGFETLKFLRSPLISLFYAFILALFTDTYLYIALAALGYTVATIETYKTFFFPSKPRGKFAGKPILYPDMLVRRMRFVPLYVAIWLAIIGAYAAAFAEPRNGLLARG
jgi:hypothetical protein